MFKFKGIAVTVLFFHCSLTVAGTMVLDEANTSIQVPCHENQWRIGVEALYFEHSFGGNGLGYTAFSNYSGNDNNGEFIGSSGAPNYMYNIFPNWGLGFQLNGAYQLEANDFSLSWSHLKSSHQAQFPIGYAFSGNNDGFYGSNFQVTSRWDELDFEVGHRLQLTERYFVRVHAGAEFASINNQFDNAPLLHPSSVIAYTTKDSFSYLGFGPRLGIDLNLRPNPCFLLYTKIAGSLLVGRARQDNSGYQNYPYPNNPISLFQTGNYYQSQPGVVVPELAAKLGVTYDWSVEHGLFQIDFGYFWANYLNAIINYTGNGIVFANVGNSFTANFNLNGVYLGFNAAYDV